MSVDFSLKAIAAAALILLAGCGGGEEQPSAVRYIPVRAGGLYVQEVGRIDRDPILITASDTEPVALIPEHTVASGAVVTGAVPDSLVYRTVGAIGGDYLWSVDLAADSNLAPRRVGSLRLRSDDPSSADLPTLCQIRSFLGKLDDPQSAFVLLGVSDASDGSCTFPFRQLLVNATDSAGTDPVEVEVDTGTMEAIYYPDQTLAGLVVVDVTTGDLVYYNDASFESRINVVPDAGYFTTVRGLPASIWTDLGGPQTYVVLQVEGSGESGFYRVDQGGGKQLLHTDPSVNQVALFGADLYVQTRDSMTLEYSVLRIPVDGSAPAQPLWSEAPDAGCNALLLTAVAGSKLVLLRHCFGPTTAENSSQLLVTSATMPGSPIEIADFAGLGNYAGVLQDNLLVNLVSYEPGSAEAIQETAIVSLEGGLRQPRERGVFMMQPDATGGPALQVREVTGPALGEGTLHRLTADASGLPMRSRISAPDGGQWSLPADATAIGATPVGGRALGVYDTADELGVLLAIDLDQSVVAAHSIAGYRPSVITFERF